MITEELLNFVRAQIASGMHPDEIERLLVGEGGWDKGDVEEAMASLGGVSAPQITSLPVLASIPEEVAPTIPVSEEPPSLEPSLSPVLTESVLVVGEKPAESLLASEPSSAPDPTSVVVFEPAPSPTKDAPEDFLGIFDGGGVSTEQKSPKAEVVSIASAPPLSSDLAPTSPPPPAADIVPTISLEQAAPTPSSSPLPPMAAGTLPSKEEKESQLIAPSSSGTTSGVRFDLSAIQKSANVPSVQTSTVGMPGAPVEIKSATEAWLAGGQNSKNDRDAAATAAASGLPKENKPIIRRTMGSDLLLRGSSATIAGVPSLLPEEEKPPTPPLSQKETPTKVIPRVVNRPLAEDIIRRNKIKKILLIMIGALVALIVLAGGVFLFLKTKAPDKVAIFNSVFENFLASSAFGYRGEGKVDLGLSMTTNAGEQEGSMKFDFAYGGALQNGTNGFGDGTHRVKLTGGLQSGEFLWSTDIETDVKVVGDILYFHVLALPDSADMDPDVLRTYWIKVDLADIARELSLEGVAAAQEGYGSFGGGASETTFNALLKKAMPFTIGDLVAAEVSSGPVLHYKLNADPDRMIELVSLLMRKYANKDLILSEEKKLRLRDAFAKMSGEIWVNSETGTLMKFTIGGTFDDEMFDMHVKGPVALSFDLSDFNKKVTTETPTPILTLEELHMRTEDYKKIKEKRAHDQQKLDSLSLVRDALALYYDEYKKYPASLAQLEQSGRLATSSVDSTALKQYSYVSYIKDDVFTKAGRCTAKGKICEFYHIGVGLEDLTNPALEGDADQVDDVLGRDVSGCAGEVDVACYDITSMQGVSATTTSETQEVATPVAN